MPFQSFTCPQCDCKATSVDSFDCGNERIHTLSCSHTFVEALIARYSARATELESIDGKRLKPYQITGVDFIENSNFNCLVADQMRLGKTPQALMALRLHPECLPCMTITKSNIKYQWAHEIPRWFNDLDVIVDVIDGSTEMIMPRAQFYIFSYDILRRFNGKLIEFVKNRGIKTIILDECQQIKNTDSQRAIELRKIIAGIPYKIGLSGTPIKNNAVEYFSVLNILHPELFRVKQNFINQWVDMFWDGYRYKYGGIRNPKRFLEYTKNFIIRRERSDVWPDFPPLDRQFQYYDLKNEVMQVYDGLFKELYEYLEFGGAKDSAFERASNTMAMLAKLRHVVAIAKVDNCIDYVMEFLGSTDRKIVIFLHHHDARKIIFNKLTQLCAEIGIDAPMQVGPGDNAYETVEEFKRNSSRILILRELASGEGLTLGGTGICDFIMYERQWNPANEEQCEDRFPIVDENTKITGTYMIGLSTVDEYLTEIVERKREFVQKSMTGQAVKWNEREVMIELEQKLITIGREKWSL